VAQKLYAIFYSRRSRSTLFALYDIVVKLFVRSNFRKPINH